MPIYEYRCADCKRKVSLFFASFSAADRRTEAGELECPRCSGKALTRLMSRVNMVRGSQSEDQGGMDDFGDMDDMGGMGGMGGMGSMGGMDGMDDMGAMGSMFEGLDDEDPRSVARWARRMKDSMGPEMDMGPEFDQALSRIEAGEDPDRVMDDMDPSALGGMPGMGDMDDIGGGLDDD